MKVGICKGKMPLLDRWLKNRGEDPNGEPFDMEKGLAMAICKKLCANHGGYYNIFRE